jgi:hypothetical protein
VKSTNCEASHFLVSPLFSLDLVIPVIFVEEYKLQNISFCSFSITSSRLGPSILLSNLISNTLNLCSSCNVRDQVSYPYRATGKVTVLYILIFVFIFVVPRYFNYAAFLKCLLGALV